MRKLHIVSILGLLLIGSVLLSQLEDYVHEDFRIIPQGFSITPDWFKDSDRLNRLETLNRVLTHIKESYVDPKRVLPQQMFDKALERLSISIAEVRIFRPEPNRAVVAVDKERKEFATDIPNLYALHASLSDVLKFVRTNMKSKVTDDDLEIAAIQGVLSTLDPHSAYLSKELYAETKVGTSGKFGGLGIVIGIREAKLTIIAPLDDTPASRAGLKAGDVITKIGDESTVNMDLTEAVEKMRGPKGVPVTIAILREGFPGPKEYTLVRDIIKIVSVEAELLPDKIGYVKLKSFQGNTAKDLGRKLEEMTKEAGGALKGMILDMRNNPGGLLDQAVSVSDKFLEAGSIVTTVGLSNTVRDEEKATVPGTEPPYPMVVLVNEGSASASEIVAGALKYQDRALVFGQRTFGKGSVQSIFDLPDNGALKLTIAQYFTPGNHSIQSIGVVPDVEFIPGSVSKDQLRLSRSIQTSSEAELERHFDNPFRNEAPAKPEIVVQFLSQRTAEEAQDEDAKPQTLRGNQTERVQKYLKDFEINAASDLLKKQPLGSGRKQLLLSFKDLSRTLEQQESKKIETVLLERGINWISAPKSTAKKCDPPKITSAITPTTKGFVRAGDKVKFALTIENSHSCTLYHMEAVSRSKNYVFSDREFLFGKVSPGEKISREVAIEIPKSMPTHVAEINYTFEEARGNLPKPYTSSVLIQSLPQPAFGFRYEIQDENGNGFIERGESVGLRLFVQNVGEGALGEASALLKNMNGKSIFLQKGRTALKPLKPGQQDEINFKFDVKPTLAADEFKMELTLLDNVYRVSNVKTLSFPVVKDPKVILKAQKFSNKTDAMLYTTPSTEAPAVGILNRGSVVTAIAEYQTFVRLKLPNNRLAWASRDAFIPSSATKALPSVRWTNFEPPKIKTSYEHLALSLSKDRFVKVSGELVDDQSMKDFFVMVNEKKVYYQSFSNPTSKKETFDATIPLDGGLNRILMVVRDQDDLSQRVYFLVNRYVKEDEKGEPKLTEAQSFSDDPFHPVD